MSGFPFLNSQPPPKTSSASGLSTNITDDAKYLASVAKGVAINALGNAENNIKGGLTTIDSAIDDWKKESKRSRLFWGMLCGLALTTVLCGATLADNYWAPAGYEICAVRTHRNCTGPVINDTCVAGHHACIAADDIDTIIANNDSVGGQNRVVVIVLSILYGVVFLIILANIIYDMIATASIGNYHAFQRYGYRLVFFCAVACSVGMGIAKLQLHDTTYNWLTASTGIDFWLIWMIISLFFGTPSDAHVTKIHGLVHTAG